MDGNRSVPPPQPPPPPRPLSFYCYDCPDQPYRYILAASSFPITISVLNGIKLFFTITNHSVSIISPNNNAPRLHEVLPDQNNNVPQQFVPSYMNELQNLNSNNNNEAEDEFHFLYLNGLDSENEAQDNSPFVPNHDNNAAQDINDREAEEEEEELDTPYQFHGLFLPRLPTLPAYIHITSNNRTFALLVTVNNTIHVINQALPILPPLHNNDGNCHVINQAIELPLTIGVHFNRANNNSYIDIRIEIDGTNSFVILAHSRFGTSEWAAVLDFIPDT